MATCFHPRSRYSHPCCPVDPAPIICMPRDMQVPFSALGWTTSGGGTAESSEGSNGVRHWDNALEHSISSSRPSSKRRCNVGTCAPVPAGRVMLDAGSWKRETGHWEHFNHQDRKTAHSRLVSTSCVAWDGGTTAHSSSLKLPSPLRFDSARTSEPRSRVRYLADMLCKCIHTLDTRPALVAVLQRHVKPTRFQAQRGTALPRRPKKTARMLEPKERMAVSPRATLPAAIFLPSACRDGGPMPQASPSEWPTPPGLSG